jgi:hypothetical protein
MSKLRQLLVDLGKDASVHDAYVADPKKVMADYGLTAEEVDAMLSKDLDAVKRLSGMDNLKTNSTVSAHEDK